MPFREHGIDPRTGRDRPLVKIPEDPSITKSESCGLCGGSGHSVESGQGSYCHCDAGKALARADANLPKISTPPAPTNNDRSAFDQKNKLGEQLDLFNES